MKQYADEIYYNASIFTADTSNIRQEAIALKNGRILAIGSNNEVLKYRSKTTVLFDTGNKTIMPGIIDCHLHPLWGGKTITNLSLNYLELSNEDIISKLQTFVNNDSQDTSWVVVCGWICMGEESLDRHILDKVKTKRPILVFSNDCHFAAINSKGLELAGIDNITPTATDGIIYKDTQGKPTGFFADGPAMRIFDKVSKLSAFNNTKLMKLTIQELNKHGVTCLMDARASEESFNAYRDLKLKSQLNARIYGAAEITPADIMNIDDAFDKIISFTKNYNCTHSNLPEIKIDTVKLFIDGMFLTKTAYLLEPYSDSLEANSGCSFFSMEQLELILLKCIENNLNLHAHTVGDAACELMLKAVEKICPSKFKREINITMAHDELVKPHQYSLFKKFGINATLSFQWAGYTQRQLEINRHLIGTLRLDNNFETHGKFFDAGVNTAYNSDWPIDPLDIWFNLEVGLTRQIDRKSPKLISDRTLNIYEVLKAATINAAKTLGINSFTGSLHAGKAADLIILNQNIFEIPDWEVHTIKVMKTILNGKTVYEEK